MKPTTFLGLLALILIGLKLAGLGMVADWSWWVVLSPIWMPWAIVVSVGVPALFVYAAVKVWRR
ncbi:transmembrane Fragile-X-F family protein [Pusillimonas noertemannii]|uniref:Transmembrane Fragile-X-F protein n=1 Tax=Pusillimonas noertemannii TaxID=305977 RepID=A0A2U1CRV1_9BURK|nr:transmembrane Fragile-X-F family protein [Pusillimonas noertemannii]NYT67959.1 transmembrane Fragile-X-F family protein [Pusillimonas noertemannii]PVY68632.1 hypothetical protein C7440_1043 [Pusillimonas noertemannii]TFL11900.1 transmembrane Fragile-X-F family protein [Pusillimonas noertemannii]